MEALNYAEVMQFAILDRASNLKSSTKGILGKIGLCVSPLSPPSLSPLSLPPLSPPSLSPALSLSSLLPCSAIFMCDYLDVKISVSAVGMA